jgi:hypothetical protein
LIAVGEVCLDCGGKEPRERRGERERPI